MVNRDVKEISEEVYLRLISPTLKKETREMSDELFGNYLKLMDDRERLADDLRNHLERGIYTKFDALYITLLKKMIAFDDNIMKSQIETLGKLEEICKNTQSDKSEGEKN